MVGHDTAGWAVTQPHDTARIGHDTVGSACARGLAGGVCNDTIVVS